MRPVGIFKAYDIRGLVPGELDAAAAHRIGRATARFIGGGPLLVGRDARSSSPELFRELVRGIGDEGVDVVDLGLIATPMLYFAVDHLAAARELAGDTQEDADRAVRFRADHLTERRRVNRNQDEVGLAVEMLGGRLGDLIRR